MESNMQPYGSKTVAATEIHKNQIIIYVKWQNAHV